MHFHLSEPFESLIKDALPETRVHDTDVLIIGSGYGGSIAAMQLAGGKSSGDNAGGATVTVLERGKEYRPGDFPEALGDIPGHMQLLKSGSTRPIGYADALYDFRIGKEVDVLVGCGLGGGSLINANVALEPEADTLAQAAWPREFREHPGLLQAHFKRVRHLLGVRDQDQTARDRLCRLPKFQALTRLANAIDASVETAPLTISMRPGANAVGVEQPGCNLCGNCVSGCNQGAKNTLAMNLIPLAKARGARFYTGATVLTLEPIVSSATDNTTGPNGRRWRVRVRRTATEKNSLSDEVFWVEAATVILAAGALGSTEILLRSQNSGRLQLSDRLGKRFSTNGDGFAMSYGQANPVMAIGKPDESLQAGEESCVGPTITGVSRPLARHPETGAEVRLTLEDGSAPYGVARLFGEIATTGAQLNRLTDMTLPAWFLNASKNGIFKDPLAHHNDAMDRSQILLIMGDDGAAGGLSLRASDNPAQQADTDYSRIRVDWPKAAENPCLTAADALLRSQDRKEGFDGGQYVPNPLWKTLPDDASTVMSGKLPGGRVITVHPLGGCAMGDGPDTGVVNHYGQVFKADPSARNTDAPALHEGLYVLDGSILPTALGVNPFLTISALSLRAAEAIQEQHDWLAPTQEQVSPELAQAISPVKQSASTTAAKPSPTVTLSISEQMFGRLQAQEVNARLPDWIESWIKQWAEALPTEAQPASGVAARLTGDQGLIFKVETQIEDLHDWLQKPGEELKATAKLYLNPLSAEQTAKMHTYGLPPELLQGAIPIAVGEGVVRLLHCDEPGPLTTAWRGAQALNAYRTRRQSLSGFALRQLKQRLSRWDSDASLKEPAPGLFKQIKGFWTVAKHHAQYRRMSYNFQFTPNTNGSRTPHFKNMPGEIIHLRGEKLLAWKNGVPRLWRALTNLPIELSHQRYGDAVSGSLYVDMEYMSERGLAQVVKSPNLPESAMAAAGLGMLFLRCLLQTQFWDFGSPHYPDKPIASNPHPRALRVSDNRVISPQRAELSVPLNDASSVQIGIVLTRYPQTNTQRPGQPVLLIHGLAQGSLIYCSEAIPENMAVYLWRAGFDVWLLDYRLSNALPTPAPLQGWSIEEIARYDIPAAVRHIHRVNPGKINLFAHCVGATATTMAILKGWLDDPADSFIGRVAFNAIHPWIIPSPVNRSRAKLGSFLRDSVNDAQLNPIPQPDPSAFDSMFDRLAFSFARLGELQEAEEGRARNGGELHTHSDHAPDGGVEISQGICDKMSFLYGRMWRHDQISPATHKAFQDMLGQAPGAVYRHLYYFAQQQRVTSRDGENTFLTPSAVRKHWGYPTLFIHGEQSKVFNPQSATRSAIRLSEMLKGSPSAPPVLLKRVPHFGHMDVILAQNAYKDAFPSLRAFFSEDVGCLRHSAGDRIEFHHQLFDSYRPADDLHAVSANLFSAGPIIRGAWLDSAGIGRPRMVLRLWAELSDLADLADAQATPTRRLALEGAELIQCQFCSANDPHHLLLDVAVKVDPGQEREVRIRFSLTQRQFDPETQLALSQTLHIPASAGWLRRLRELCLHRGVSPAMRFLVGSCRYPGAVLERDLADQAFVGMGRQVRGDAQLPGADSVFFIGDQIYADATAEAFDNTALKERYITRYREAFNSPNMRKLLQLAPVHFTVDDHEFSDDCSGRPPQLDAHLKERERFDFALRAARSFQCSGRQPDAALWYPQGVSAAREFDCPIFVMDTRTERRLRSAGAVGAQAEMIDAPQFAALSNWLSEAQRLTPERPKFIFSGSVIAPVEKRLTQYPDLWRNHDSWCGYPHTLAAVMGLIYERQIANVIFVGGDQHLCALARMTLANPADQAVSNRKPVTVWQIVSSGLYAPLPFANANPRDFEWEKPSIVPMHGSQLQLQAEARLLRADKSQFVRVDAIPAGECWTLEVRVCDPEGFVAPVAQPTALKDGELADDDKTWRIRLTANVEAEPGKPVRPEPA
ncbi:alpha/beta fold hydrolase [Hahella sp. HN01]|uniref:alpha/beta fold hydrolase n=1 Tax=Hahella sp. HN01 TaxID=2847262 RepID=UPI001C1F1E1E|nr:alpha/beta fold hydrolase [Hahella sp. HN01]MBU6955111.1 alpha/beta fold hydrolase [Hahella sp. HN01]